MNRTRPFLNKHTLQKQLQIVDTYHSLNMKLIKPITSKLMEHSHHITINNTKRQKIKETRDLQIERDNKILLNNISAVMNKEGSYSMSKTINFRTKLNKSLNLTERKKQDRHILEANKRLVQRLQNKKATMDLQKWRKDWCDNKEVMKRMSNRDFYLTTLRSQYNHRYTANDKLCLSKVQFSRLSRICIVDGCKMRIRIKFVGEFLNITADGLDNTSAKQISIPKDEAIYFIQSQCKGKLEYLINKLKYDSANDALFMISDSLAEVQDQDLHYYNPQIEKNQQKRLLGVQIRQKKVDTNYKNKKGKNTIELSSTSEQKVVHLRLDPQETLNSPLELLEEKIQYKPLSNEGSKLIGFQQEHNQTLKQFLSFENIVSNQILVEEPSDTSKGTEKITREILVQPEQMEDYNQIIHVPQSIQAKSKAHSLNK